MRNTWRFMNTPVSQLKAAMEIAYLCAARVSDVLKNGLAADNG